MTPRSCAKSTSRWPGSIRATPASTSRSWPGCPSGLDCAAAQACPPQALIQPDLSYLAKDFASFRQLLTDRLTLIMPSWQETHEPDLGVAVVELLSWVGDELSYYQDAVGTEAYLQTARQRISVRRHLTLIDYRLHDGCNARAWVCVELSPDSGPVTLEPGDIAFITTPNVALPGQALLWSDLSAADPGSYQVFEPLIPGEVVIYPAHSEMLLLDLGRRAVLPARRGHGGHAGRRVGRRRPRVGRRATAGPAPDRRRRPHHRGDRRPADRGQRRRRPAAPSGRAPDRGRAGR